MYDRKSEMKDSTISEYEHKDRDKALAVTTSTGEKEVHSQTVRRTRIVVTLCDDARSSYKERRADALALRAEERRDKLRKAAGRSKYPAIRGCLNGETRQSIPLSPCTESIGVRREPGELKHLSTRRKRKKHSIS